MIKRGSPLIFFLVALILGVVLIFISGLISEQVGLSPECKESWKCTWGECTDGFQFQECGDINSCGSELNKPIIIAKSCDNENVIFSQEEDKKMLEARIEIFDSEGLFYSKMYDFLDSKKGNLKTILVTCEKFNSIYCLKKASQQNPELRREICNEFALKLDEKYREMDKLNREGHLQECRLGIPQFIY